MRHETSDHQSVDKKDNTEEKAHETSPNNTIPHHCTPGPMKSKLGKELLEKSRLSRSYSLSSLNDLDNSPPLKPVKRPASNLSSPNSPTENETKKNKLGLNSVQD